MEATTILTRGDLYVGGSHGTSEARVAALCKARYDLTVREFAGNGSVEHGVGPSHAAFCRRYTDAATRDWAAALHRHFDPARLIGNVRLDWLTASAGTAGRRQWGSSGNQSLP